MGCFCWLWHAPFRALWFPAGLLSSVQHCPTALPAGSTLIIPFSRDKKITPPLQTWSPADGGFHIESSTELHFLAELTVVSS